MLTEHTTEQPIATAHHTMLVVTNAIDRVVPLLLQNADRNIQMRGKYTAKAKLSLAASLLIPTEDDADLATAYLRQTLNNLDLPGLQVDVAPSRRVPFIGITRRSVITISYNDPAAD